MDIKKLDEILGNAVEIRDAEIGGENTAVRVGGVLVEIIRNLLSTNPRLKIDAETFDVAYSADSITLKFNIVDAEGNVTEKRVQIKGAEGLYAGAFTPTIMQSIADSISKEATRAGNAEKELLRSMEYTEEELLSRLKGESLNSDSSTDAFKFLGKVSSVDELNELLDNLTYNASIVGKGFGFFRVKYNDRDVEIKNILLSSSLDVIVQVVSGTLILNEGVLGITDGRYGILMRKRENGHWGDWSVIFDSTTVATLDKKISDVLAQTIISNSVRSLETVTDAQHKEMEANGKLRKDTLYIIEDKDYVEDGEDSEFARLRKRVAAMSGKSTICREFLPRLDASKSISVRHIPASKQVHYRFTANIDSFAPITVKLGSAFKFVVYSDRMEFFVDDLEDPKKTHEYIWDDYTGGFFRGRLDLIMRYDIIHQRLCVQCFSGNNLAHFYSTLLRPDEVARLSVATQDSGVFSSCMLKSNFFLSNKNLAFANNPTCVAGADCIGFKSMTSSEALELMRYVLNHVVPSEIVWFVGLHEADDVYRHSLDGFLKTCSDCGIRPVVCTLPNTSVYSNVAKNEYIRSLNVDVIDVALYINGTENSTYWHSWYWDEDTLSPTETAFDEIFNFIYV